MTKIAVFSTCHKKGFESFGQDFIANFFQYMPDDIHLHVFSEDWETDFEHENLFIHDIEQVEKWRNFKLKHLDKCGIIQKGKKNVYNYRYNAVGFSAKIFPLQVLAEMDYDWIVVMDMDIVFHKKLPKEELLANLHPGATAVFLGRKDYAHSETGFVAYNMRRYADRMIDRMIRLYDSGKVFELKGWTDSYVFDHVREELQKVKTDYYRFSNISEEVEGLHVWPHTWLGEYMEHLKGPAAKSGVPWLNEFPNTLIGQAVHTVSQFKPRTMIDIGVMDGVRAVGMAKASLWAQKQGTDENFGVHLWALDPFGDKEEEILQRFSDFAKQEPRFTYTYINQKKESNRWNSELQIEHENFGRLELGKSDFAYVDGEHKKDSLNRDLFKLLPFVKLVMTPTYLMPDEEGKCEDTAFFGCNDLLESTPHKILPAEEKCEKGGIVRAAVFGPAVAPGSGKVQTKNAVPDEQIQTQIHYSLKHHPLYIKQQLEEIHENLQEIRNRRYVDFVAQCDIHDLSALILAGGPSICDTKHPDYDENWRKITETRQRKDVRTFVVKTCHDHMIYEREEIPWGCILLDPRNHVQDFIQSPHPEVRYFAASMCHPTTWDVLLEKAPKLYGYNAAVKAGELEYVKHKMKFDHAVFFGGGSSSATRGIGLCHGMGFRKYILAGWDQCWPEYMEIDFNDEDTQGRKRFMEYKIEDTTYVTQPILLAACQDFENSYREHPDLYFDVLTTGMVHQVWNKIKRNVGDFSETYD